MTDQNPPARKKGQHDKQWKPGQSGNPAGRSPGSSGIAKLRKDISEHVPEIIAKLAEQAKAGDATSARLLLERALPPYKAAEESTPLTLPDGTLTDQGRAVLAAVSRGELAAGQGSALLTALGSLAKLHEVDELEKRLRALEERVGEKP